MTYPVEYDPNRPASKTFTSSQTAIWPCQYDTNIHQITVSVGTATAGTLTLTAKPWGASGYETVYDSFGSAIVFTLAASYQKTYSISGYSLVEFKLTPAGVNGTYIVSGADMDATS